tara:strand:+ start:701 stop:4573 length:3873 start_codon:yes stop_codon:yes gene_type:complete
MAQRPQDLAKTLDDFKRIGKGVAIGETFDILGAPADLADAFFSVRKALFPYSDLGEARAAEELAKGIGSEALIKKAGIDIPEMGFNLESAGRVMAPGFLLTKGAIGLKLLSQMMDKTPPPAGGFAMATTGASKIPAPPPTTAEQLMMTTDQTLPSMPEPPKKADVFEDDYLKKDVSLAARISTDNVFYSNLLQEIENIGTGQGELQQIIQTRMPMLETFTTKKGKTAQRPVRDDAGNIMYEQGVTTRIEGIEFPMTGEQILEKFKTLKGGINSRLYKEAEEVGLIRYLELNPKEKFKADGGKEKLYNIASQFTPDIEVNVYKESDQLALDSQIANLKTTAADPTLTQEQKTDLLDQIRNLEGIKRRSRTGMSNKGAQRIDPGGDSVYDVVHTIFGTGSKGNKLLGSSVDRFNSSNTVKKAYQELEDFFKSVGDTASIKELKRSYSEHGFNDAVDGGYFAHTRAVDGFMGFELGANAPKLEDSRFVNELQINQGMTKKRKLIQDSPERTAEVQRNIANQRKRLQDVNDSVTKAGDDFRAGRITQEQRNAIIDLAQIKQREITTVINSLNKALNNKNDIILNSTLMDTQQILKLDKENNLGISTFTEKKVKLQDELKEATRQKDEFLKDYDKLEKLVTPLKEKVFKVDNDLNSAAVSQSLYNMNKSATTRFFDEDIDNPFNNAPLFALGPNSSVQLPANRGPLRDLDEASVKKMDMALPDSIKRYISNRFTQEEAEALVLKGADASARGGLQDSTRTAKQFLVNRKFQFRGDFKDNSLFEFLNRGKDARIIDKELLRDHYQTVDRLIKNKKIDPVQFSEKDRHLADSKALFGGFEAPVTDVKSSLNFAKYIQMKILDNPDYFKDPKNVSKFFKDAYRNHGLELERKYIKASVMKNIVNNNDFRKLVGKDNIKELAQRLETIDQANRKKLNDPTAMPNYFDDERKKIFQDFLTDAELDRTSKAKGSQIIQKIINETVDAYTLQNNSIPIPQNTLNSRLKRTKNTSDYNYGIENVVDFTYTPPKKLLGVIPGARGTVDFKFIDLSPEVQKYAVKKDLFTDVLINEFSKFRNPIIESMAHQERLAGLDKEKLILENRAKDLIEVEIDLKEKLRPFEQRGAVRKLVDKLGDKVPQKVKDSLEETLKHVDPNESFQLAKNPPIQDSQQGLELMVHRMISDAKQEGKRYIIFPKLADYASARSSGDPKKYSFAAGTQQLGSILKKYGDAYFTKERLYSSSSDISPSSTQMIEIGKTRGAPVNEESDLFRIIDLSKIDSDLKVPRFKKGGIFSKFRKVA